MSTITMVRGCWAANIGNAFLDLGSEASIKKACNNATIVITGSYPIWFFKSRGFVNGIIKKTDYSDNYFSFIDAIKTDYVVFTGMVLREAFIKRYGQALEKLTKSGTKVVFNGVGGFEYNQKEFDTVKAFYEKIKPYAIITRDEDSFKQYATLSDHTLDGIDCAYFIYDHFQPPALNIPPYQVFNFDSCGSLAKYDTSLKVIHAHHSVLNLKNDFLKEEDTLISDQPEDYLSLYSNAKAVYSDRVHACVATLTSGGKCQLLHNTPRAKLFEKIGINRSELHAGLVQADLDKIKELKKKQVEFLSSIIQ